jgi:hypothetical protein
MSTICRPARLIRIEGDPELSFLFIFPSDADIQRALESWAWLDLAAFTPIAVSAFGDVFFEGPQGVVMLDTIEGRLMQVAGDEANLIAALQTEKARDDILLAGLVIGARTRSLILEPGECYDFMPAPILGGAINAESVRKMSFVVKLHIAGQLHDQVRKMAPGTRITHFSMKEE